MDSWLPQIDVAERAGLRQGYIAEIEAGKKTGSAVSLKAVAAALGCRSTSSWDDTALRSLVRSERRIARHLRRRPIERMAQIGVVTVHRSGAPTVDEDGHCCVAVAL